MIFSFSYDPWQKVKVAVTLRINTNEAKNLHKYNIRHSFYGGSTKAAANRYFLSRHGQPYGRIQLASAVIHTRFVFIDSIHRFELRSFVRSLRQFLLKYFGWTLNGSIWEPFDKQCSTVYIYIMQLEENVHLVKLSL